MECSNDKQQIDKAVIVNMNDYVIVEKIDDEKKCNADDEMQILTISEIYADDPIFGPIINKLALKQSERIKRKIMDILSSLLDTRRTIDIAKIKKIMNEGLPDEFPGIRSMLWKLMFRYLPDDFRKWKDFLNEKRLYYECLKMDYIDLSDEKSAFLFSEVVKDVKRTRSQMHFFSQPTAKNPKESHLDVLTRILFIFGKLHPNIGYVQGMNEMVAILYFCFSTDTNPFFTSMIEADVFYCFEGFMGEISEIFIREKDYTESGIYARISKIALLLEKYDSDLYDHFLEESMELHFFAFRWFSLFFTQEFNMPEVLRLWDSLVVQSDKMEFTTYFIFAMLINNRELLLSNDFSGIMHFTQHLSSEDNLDINKIVKSALAIQEMLTLNDREAK